MLQARLAGRLPIGYLRAADAGAAQRRRVGRSRHRQRQQVGDRGPVAGSHPTVGLVTDVNWGVALRHASTLQVCAGRCNQTWHTAPVLIVTIHHRPRWANAEYVAVEWLMWVGPTGPGAQPMVHECPTLERARLFAPASATRHDPLPTDEPSQVETWI